MSKDSEYLDLTDLLDISTPSEDEVSNAPEQVGESDDKDIDQIKEIWSDSRVKICYSELDEVEKKKIEALEARTKNIENFRSKYFLRQPLFELCENEIKFFLDKYDPPLPIKIVRPCLFPHDTAVYLPITLDGIGFYDRKQWIRAQIPLNEEEFTEYAYYHSRKELGITGSSSSTFRTTSSTSSTPLTYEEMPAKFDRKYFDYEQENFGELDTGYNYELPKPIFEDNYYEYQGEMLGEYEGSERIYNREIRYGDRKFLTGEEQWLLNDIRMHMLHTYRNDDERLFFMKFILENDPSLDPKTKYEVEKVIKGLDPMKNLRKPPRDDRLHSFSLDKILFYNPTALSGSSQRNLGLLEHRRIIAQYPCPRVEAPEKFITWMEPLYFEARADSEIEWVNDPPSDTEIDYVVELHQRRLWKEIKWKYKPGGDTRTIPVPRVYTTPRLARYILSNPTIPYTMAKMNKRVVVMVRHGESVFNQKNLFCGWYDAELSEKGVKEATEGGMTLCKLGYKFDVAHVSMLQRAQRTLAEIKEALCQNDLPTYCTWRLNERHYGALTGLNKAETAAKYGEEQVKIWRRSFDVPPPPMEPNHEHYSKIVNHPAYKKEPPKEEFPMFESLKMTIERTLPYWNQKIVPDLKEGKKVLIVAHGNSLRGLVKHLDCLSDEQIMDINLPTGIPFLYELDEQMKPVTSMKFLGDEATVKRAMESVAAQGKKK